MPFDYWAFCSNQLNWHCNGALGNATLPRNSTSVYIRGGRQRVKCWQDQAWTRQSGARNTKSIYSQTKAILLWRHCGPDGCSPADFPCYAFTFRQHCQQSTVQQEHFCVSTPCLVFVTLSSTASHFFLPFLSLQQIHAEEDHQANVWVCKKANIPQWNFTIFLSFTLFCSFFFFKVYHVVSMIRI